MDENQQFLKQLDKKLWTAADKLRSNLDAAVYKHAVLGLIFLKYVSDSFEIRQQQVEEQLRDSKSDYFLDPADYEADEYDEEIRAELEVRDYYVEENVFWVPALARWKTIQESAPLASGTEITVTNGKKKKYKITSIGKLIDDALAEVEDMNTDAAVPDLNRNNAYRLEIPNASQDAMDEFTTVATTIRNQIAGNDIETAQLATARDTLLPQLLSGELPVPAAMTRAEEALA